MRASTSEPTKTPSPVSQPGAVNGVEIPGRKRQSDIKPTRQTPKKRVKVEDADRNGLETTPIKPEKRSTPIKAEVDIPPLLKKASLSPSREQALQAKKLKAYGQFAKESPFPDFPHPTPDECRLAHQILAGLHGERVRPSEVKASATRAGCGESPSVLDALVRTILSQNTSDANSTRAKLSMDAVYGGSDEWAAIARGGQAKLQEAIKCGGLSAVKSKVIIGILHQAKEKYGSYSLDHLFGVSNEEAMEELIGFQGVGPKTASCVLLFCLQRDSFAVDTHVWRITGLLGWRPKSASRDETYAHLDLRIPDEEKYALHILLVTHGRACEECKAGGKIGGNCELRKAFRREKLAGSD